MSDPARSTTAAADELFTKRARLQGFLDRHELDGVLLWKRAGFAWLTCGGDNRVVDGNETGVAGLLATREGCWCLADAIEAPRMRDEELAGSDIGVVEFPWHDEQAAARRVAELLGDAGVTAARIAADVARPALPFASLPAEFAPLRWQLTPAEIERYRESGQRASRAVESAAMSVRPGMSEQAISGLLDEHVRGQGLVPLVNLVAADERIFRFRHPIPTARKLERYVMLVTCAAYRGLISNLTRFVHFGEPPAELKRRQQAVADVDAAAILATRTGRSLGDVFVEIQQAYRQAEFADEWKLHHQGGSTGYAPREVVARPGEPTVILENQAFAWNPSITGAKSEDTLLCMPQGHELLTSHSHLWPTIIGRWADQQVDRAACLVR